MNQFCIAGRILEIGERRSAKSPFPLLLETSVGRDKTCNALIEAYPPKGGEFAAGDYVLLAGHMESREWNGRKYLNLVVTQTTLLPPPWGNR